MLNCDVSFYISCYGKTNVKVMKRHICLSIETKDHQLKYEFFFFINASMHALLLEANYDTTLLGAGLITVSLAKHTQTVASPIGMHWKPM